MEKTISVREAVEIINRAQKRVLGDEVALTALQTVKREIQMLAGTTSWRPVSQKKLPEEEEDVLVTVFFHGWKQRHENGWNDDIKPSYYVEVARLMDDEWSSDSDEFKIARNRHEVLAWMPLPEPYRPEVDPEDMVEF